VVVKVLHDEPAFSTLFISYLLARNVRMEADLVDPLFNSSEKRMARLLLLLANFGKEGKPEPRHRQGQPRDARRDDRHVSFFMNKFGDWGLLNTMAGCTCTAPS
jgi:CRP/FNR family cyclic AMP-dependent transcriptional regulator